jgi:hypothetical protein
MRSTLRTIARWSAAFAASFVVCAGLVLVADAREAGAVELVGPVPPPVASSLARGAAYVGVYDACSAALTAAHGQPSAGEVWAACELPRATLVDAGDDVRLGA